MATVTHRDLQWLKSRIGDQPNFQRHLIRLQKIASLIESECPDAVSWVVAHGPLSERLDTGSAVRVTQSSLKLLVVTTLPSFFDATMLLGEKVFGPVLTELGAYTEFDVWTSRDLKAASKASGPLWNELLSGIWLYGSPGLE